MEDFLQLIPKFTVGSKHSVIVTCLNSPDSFYVRGIEIETHPCVGADLIKLEAGGDKMPRGQIKVGQCVIYKTRTLQRNIRGTIVKILNPTEERLRCNIFAIDYGYHHNNVYEDNIYLPASDFSTICPPLAQHCKLFMCEPIPPASDFGPDVVEAMETFVGKHIARIIVKSIMMDKLIVELKTVECPDDVSTMLALLHYTQMLASSKSLNRFVAPKLIEIHQYKFKDVHVGDQLCVIVRSGINTEKFYVALYCDYQEYKRKVYEFTDYCRQQPEVDIDKAIADSRSCGIRILQRGEYERGIVLKKTEDGKALTKLVDSGEEIEVPHHYIKDAPSEFFRHYPAIAIYCSTSDPTWQNNLPKFFYPGYQLIIKIIALGDGLHIPHKVNMYKHTTKKVN